VVGASDYPTILIVHRDMKFWDVLILDLRQLGYLILEANDAVEALEIVIRQSRRIHLLLVGDGDDGRATAETLNPYRRDMDVIYVNPDLEIDSALKEVSRVLPPSPHPLGHHKRARKAAT
jgi:hypothetical protein